MLHKSSSSDLGSEAPPLASPSWAQGANLLIGDVMIAGSLALEQTGFSPQAAKLLYVFGVTAVGASMVIPHVEAYMNRPQPQMTSSGNQTLV